MRTKGHEPALIPAVREGMAGWLLESGRFIPRIAGADPALDQLKDKLDRVENDLAAKRSERAEKMKDRDAAKAAFAGVDEYDTNSQEFKDATEAVKAVGEIDEALAELSQRQVGLLKMLGQDDRAHATERDGTRADDEQNNGVSKGWDAAALLRKDGVAEKLKAAAGSSERMNMNLGEVISRDAFKADITGTTDMRTGPYYGIVPQIYRPLRVLDLLPTATMDNNQFPYTQEGGTFLAAETTEGTSKPEDGVTYTDATAIAETIAAWQKIRKQSLEDISALQGIIENRLRYSVRRRLEAQVLNGNGSTPNIQGIIGTSGVQTVVHGTDLADSAPSMDLILVAMTKIILADADPSAIVMHPTDWSEALRSKTSGSGEYFSNGPFNITAASMWGLPLLASPAIPLAEALVGDFDLGATLFIRSGVQVLLSDSDQSDFIQNRITLLGEMRAALAVWRPSAFCTATLKEIS